MKLALTGDVMLGRLVDEFVIRNPDREPAWVWGDCLPLFAGAEARLINLECVIANTGSLSHPEEKVFHFHSHPRAIETLRTARIDAVSLANNHVLDFGDGALLECFNLLDQAGVVRAARVRGARVLRASIRQAGVVRAARVRGARVLRAARVRGAGVVGTGRVLRCARVLRAGHDRALPQPAPAP